MSALFFRVILPSLVFALFASPASAGTQTGPTLGFQMFNRLHPSELGIIRLSGGLFVLSDVTPIFAVHGGLLYTTENTVFESEAKFEEKSYRARLGVFGRLWQTSVFKLGLILGAQYGYVRQRYETVQPNTISLYRMFSWSPYLTLEGQVLPVSGFGIREGLSAFYDPIAKSWIPEFYIGAIF